MEITRIATNIDRLAREHEALIGLLGVQLRTCAKSAKKPARFGVHVVSASGCWLEGEDGFDPHCIVPAIAQLSLASVHETASSPVYAQLRLALPDGKILAGFGRSVPRADSRRASAVHAAACSLGLSIPSHANWRWQPGTLLAVLALAAGWPAERLELDV